MDSPFHVLSQRVAGGINTACVVSLGGDSGKLASGFHLDISHAPLLVADFALYPFIVMYLSCEVLC